MPNICILVHDISNKWYQGVTLERTVSINDGM